MTHKNILGMDLEVWEHKSCLVQVGVGDNYATIYFIESKEQGKGHAQELLKEMKEHYEYIGKTFGSYVALTPGIKHLIQKLGIKEYK